MLEKFSKLWPLVTVVSFAIVSLFNIGYFYMVGLHFLGVMDLSNFVYAVGLVLGSIIGPLAMLPVEAIETMRREAKKPDASSKFMPLLKVWTVLVLICFTVGLFFTDRFLSIMTLFSMTFASGTLVSSVWAYMIWQQEGARSWGVIAAPVGAAMLTIFWIGGTVAQHEALYTKQTYKFQTKDSEYPEARIVRASSSGFIISQDKKFTFVPSGEVKRITQLKSSFE